MGTLLSGSETPKSLVYGPCTPRLTVRVRFSLPLVVTPRPPSSPPPAAVAVAACNARPEDAPRDSAEPTCASDQNSQTHVLDPVPSRRSVPPHHALLTVTCSRSMHLRLTCIR